MTITVTPVWPEKVQLDKLAAPLTTYRIGGPIDEFYAPESREEFIQLLEKIPADCPLTIIGWGGNTLVATQGIRGIVIWTRKLDAVVQHNETTFTMACGVHLAKAAKVAADAGCSGGEFFIGIPGTVGGAVRMNAGALGQQTSDVVVRATVWDRHAQTLEEWPAEALGFAYRHCQLDSARHIVVEATLRFTKTDDVASVKERMAASVTFRKTHHPIEPNGGSVFRNPLPTAFNPHPWPVGRLLDSLGAKGRENETKNGQAAGSANPSQPLPCWQEGGASISPRHANFIINTHGHATSTEVLRLMARMKSSVAEEFGLAIVPENLFLGDATPEEADLWQHLTATAVA